MPTFEIPDGPTTVELKRSGAAGPATGSIVFNVTNRSADPCDGRLGVIVSGQSKEAWFSIDGDRERSFAAGETQTAKINISTPPDVAAGSYPFRLRAVSVSDPDNDHAEGPVATANVPAATGPAPTRPKWWLWIVIGVIALLLIIAALWFAFGRSEPTPVETQPVTAACSLSGVWQGNDNGTYTVTESGNLVSWIGRHNGGGWAHRFSGTRSGDTIEGNWADFQGLAGRGTLTIRVDKPTHMTRVANTGSGFGGTAWSRASCP